MGDTKNSLLYFDYVVPAMGTIEIVYMDQSEEGREYLKNAKSLGEEITKIAMQVRFLEMAKALPPAFKAGNLMKQLVDLNVINFDMYYSRFETSPPEISSTEFSKEVGKSFAMMKAIISNSKTPCEITFGLPNEIGISAGGKEPEVTLSNIGLVDVAQASVPQILEFREDKESRIGLLRLRKFLSKDCAGFTVNQVEDELMLALDDYEKISKKWDFQTRASSLSILLNTKKEMMAFGGSLLAAISGAPLASAVAASVGTAFVIGKVGLNIAEKTFDKREILGTSPISYIVHAKDKLEGE